MSAGVPQESIGANILGPRILIIAKEEKGGEERKSEIVVMGFLGKRYDYVDCI